MGTSLPSTISPIMRHVLSIKRLNNVLDVGVGESGRWGFLLRDICDGTIRGRSFSKPETWHLKIDGIEAYEPYRNYMHDHMYDKIYWGDMVKVLDEMPCQACDPKYDLVLFLATIEHLEKSVGLEVLRKLKRFMVNNGMLIISTPHGFSKQTGSEFDNPYDYHKCGYTEADIPNIVALGYDLVESMVTYDNRFIMVFRRK